MCLKTKSSLDLQACGFSWLAVFWLLCVFAGKSDPPAVFADWGAAGATVKLSPEENARVALHRRADAWTSKWKKHQKWDHAFAVMLEKNVKSYISWVSSLGLKYKEKYVSFHD